MQETYHMCVADLDWDAQGQLIMQYLVLICSWPMGPFTNYIASF